MLRKLYILLIAVLLLALLSTFVSAAEIPDWDTVDWENYDWKNIIDGNEEAASLGKWLSEKASLAELFEVTRTCRSESFYSLIEIRNQRFIADPERFLITLAKENEQTQTHVITDLFSVVVLLDHDATIRAIEGIRLSKEKNPEAVELMMKLISTGEEKLKEQGKEISIAIPKTGDPVIGAAAALLLSGTALVLVYRKKKN